ncbi:MAG: rhodanese-related sulfurtransferase [Verrucomicrobiota bacterium]|nr:rhodanese-related sulfurtransferase [Verrucomicrobiota bacterium]
MTQTVTTFYRFVDLPDCEEFRTRLEAECKTHSVLGTIILATEGLNATIAGSKAGVWAVLAFIRSDARFADMPHRECKTERETFHRLRLIIRPEIVTLGDPSANPNKAAGKYVAPEDWNELISDSDVLLIDTRNDYEVELGTFKNAVNPNTAAFGEWDAFVQKNLSESKKQKVAMFCTGGIRCEKASAHLLKEGFEEVYHLQGGILKYLQETKPEESLWEGECFVFDHRVTVVHGLERGTCEICFGCRWPLTPEDLASPAYEPGICCPRCIDALTPELRARREERQRQQTLARQRGEKHIGQLIETPEQ